MDEDPDIREQLFHNTVREYIIFLLLFILLYISSFVVISMFKRKEREEYCSVDEEDAKVYRISLWLCTFSLAVAVGAALLLPISIISNEVLLLYPNSYYMKWLNSSLIQGLWNHIFLFSNLSLFILLPFAYLFIESEGFAGSQKGLMARVYETFVMLLLLSALVMGMTYLLSALIDHDKSSLESLFNLWTYYLPFLYSCVSFVGVVMLLLCTPLGFARLFTVVGKFVVQPQFLRDVHDDYYVAKFEVDRLRWRLRTESKNQNNGIYELQLELNEADAKREKLDRSRKASIWQSHIVYPIVMLTLVALTGIAGLMVAHNSLQLLIGIKALPITSQNFSLGISSLSALGVFGAGLEIILIIYLMVTSFVGFYTLPFFSSLRPKIYETPMTHVLGNCTVVLIMSCALPLLTRTLGITNFDLLGDFGSITWLGNFYIVFLYNIVFTVAAAVCLFTKFTAAVRRELLLCWESISLHALFKPHRILNINSSPHED